MKLPQVTELFNGSVPDIGAGMGTGVGWRITHSKPAGREAVTGLNIPFTSTVTIRYAKAIYGGANNQAPSRINGVDVPIAQLLMKLFVRWKSVVFFSYY